MFDKNIFVTRINLLLSTTKTTKQALANVLEIRRQSVSQFAHGDTLPSIDTLVSIAQYFNVSVDYLLGLTDNKEINK